MALTNLIQTDKNPHYLILFRVDSKSCTYINPHSHRQTDRRTDGHSDKYELLNNASYIIVSCMKLYSIENQLILIIFFCLLLEGGFDVVHGGSFLFDLAPLT